MLRHQAHQLQQFPGSLHRVGPFGADELQGETDVVQGGALHEQVEALENHADVLPGLAQLLVPQLGQVLAVHQDRPGGGALQQVHAPD